MKTRSGKDDGMERMIRSALGVKKPEKKPPAKADENPVIDSSKGAFKGRPSYFKER